MQLESKAAADRSDKASGVVAPARYLSMVMIVLSLGVAGVVVYIVLGINKTLAESAGELRDSADQVANAATQVSSSSQALAQGLFRTGFLPPGNLCFSRRDQFHGTKEYR